MCSVCFRYWHLQNRYIKKTFDESVASLEIEGSCVGVLPGPGVQQLYARGVPLGQPEVSRVQNVPPGPFQQKPTPTKEHRSRVSIESEGHAVL